MRKNVDDEDDDEISEDEAFNSEDERKYGDFFASRKSSSVEDEEEIEEEEEGGTLLTDMLETSKEEAEKQRRELLELLELSRGKRSVKERSEGLTKESEHALSNDTKLSLEDLTADVSEPGLSKRLADLSKTKTKEAPLAPVIKERIERTVHYASTKKQVKEWVPFVQANRKSEHLSFVALNQAQRQKLTTHALVATHKPTTGIEKTVDSLLKASGMDSDRKIKNKEEAELMKMKIVDPEELRRRRKELQKMRALMTYVSNAHVKSSTMMILTTRKKQIRGAEEQTHQENQI